MQEQAQAYFDELFDTKEGQDGTLSDVGTIVAGGTPSKSKPEYYTENGIALSRLMSGELDVSDISI